MGPSFLLGVSNGTLDCAHRTDPIVLGQQTFDLETDRLELEISCGSASIGEGRQEPARDDHHGARWPE
jgi:hypothetical protein